MAIAYTIGGHKLKVISTAASISSWVTATSTGYGITGATLYTYGPYAAPAGSAHCYEQLFAYRPDPVPETEDWFNEVTTMTVTDSNIESFSDVYGNVYPGMTFSASAACTSTAGSNPTPIFRGVIEYNDSLSATIPINGYRDVSWHRISTGDGYPYIASASASGSITDIVGAHPGTYHFAVAAHNPLFGTTREQWAAGECTSAPEGCYLSGRYIFGVYKPEYGNYTASAFESAVVTASSMSPEIMAREEGV